ncbi:Gfo/Idh/MocA family oxidoreductase [Mucilaginibacter sp.]|jgi:predicted dehydrogenase|uniref:Gfo/Idh/MocA family protein n=1 Tax=Mucilaginibacter sp. TaxID=1882438 RepID=UPI002C004328|nr:Gfo/Idh/MocA family oxidoreductase [Mucilaginibacter sp.]HTI61155.1 Gfo/Idh/MocA family oxidoreductase [Mucilaginibacter sp.]
MIKFGIIGCGRISHRFMQGLAAVEGTELAVAWSRRAESVEQFTKQYGGRACATLDELLASDIDVAYIATLPDSHAFYSIAALNAGKHVLCEKPATVNLAQLEEVLKVARASKLLFMEGMKPPFFPLYRKLKEYLETDPIGPVGYVRAGSSVADLSHDHPNFSYNLIGGGIMQILPYEAFLALDWLGPLTDIQTMGRFSGKEVDMFAVIQTEHEGGYSQLYCGFDLHGKGDALIAGTLGHITIHKNWWNPTKATIDYLDGRKVEIDEPFTAGGLNYEIAHFCDLIRTGQTESPIITHELSRGMMALLNKAREQVGLRFEGE